MTESEWLAATDPTSMLAFVRGAASNRKLKMLAVACCRRVWDKFSDERSRHAVVIAEEVAEGRASQEAITSAWKDAQDAYGIASDAFFGHRTDYEANNNIAHQTAGVHIASGSEDVLTETAKVISYVSLPRYHPYVEFTIDDAAVASERTAQADFVRDIFGNPFRLAIFPPDWRPSTAVAIAQGMYESRNFSAMPILADALQDAGCESKDILEHCRDANAVHVRGCWVVDLILGKS